LSGEVAFPFSGWCCPPSPWGFPPALIPLWSDAALFLYQGYWKHWFCDRETTLVEVDSSEGRATEVARGFPQVVARLALKRVCALDRVDERLKQFCAGLGLEILPAVDEVSRRTGDRIDGLLAMKLFSEDPPADLVSFGGSYRGNFPQTGDARDDSCAFEWVAPEPGRARSGHSEAFHFRLRRGDLLGAWMQLNAPGWEMAESRRAIQELADASSEPEFKLLTKAWLEANAGDGFGY
jgi:hypothetical protein